MSRTEAELTSRLRRMQWLATSLLALMAIVFVATSLLREAHPLLNPIWAFSEAALIGGLADWFAVTALFRHPLGLPIPHTAIVPTRKDEIGRALAGFVGRHFLTREALEVRLARVDLAERLGDWLSAERNAELLSRDAAVALDWLLRSVDSAELRDSIGASLRDSLDHIPVNRAVATLIDVLASGNHSQALIDRLVEFGRDVLRDNQQKIRGRIRDRSPWWMPRFVDEEIYDQLVGEFERILDEVGDNPVHPARIELNVRLKSLQHDLSSDPELIKKGEALRDEFLRHPATRRFFHDAWHRLRDYLLASFTAADSSVRRGLQTQIASIGTSVAEDPEVRERLNLWLRELVVYIVENYRDSLTRIISDTIAQWDPEATGQRIELHIGKDLQFIRINGTLVGGLVGLLLYAGWQVIGA